jgi:CMP-N,N'-diacetyllegionaminic acid synthase
LNILGVIPARGGSKEVPRKNLLKIGAKSLIELAVDSANKSQFLTRFLLSSDDDEIIEEGKKVGCPVFFKRPSDIATDEASLFSVLKHAVAWLDKNEQWNPEIIVILQPTTPFRRGYHIDGVLELLIKTKADAVITIRKPDYPPQWMVRLDKDKKIANLIEGGNLYKRRQDTPETYQPAGMVYAFKVKLLYEIDTLFPFKDTRGYNVKKEDAINIDTFFDYEIAKIIYEKNIKRQT